MSHGKLRMTHRKTDKADKCKVEKPSLDDVWPVHSAGGWPRGLSLDRADIYEGIQKPSPRCLLRRSQQAG